MVHTIASSLQRQSRPRSSINKLNNAGSATSSPKKGIVFCEREQVEVQWQTLRLHKCEPRIKCRHLLEHIRLAHVEHSPALYGESGIRLLAVEHLHGIQQLV